MDDFFVPLLDNDAFFRFINNYGFKIEYRFCRSVVMYVSFILFLFLLRLLLSFSSLTLHHLIIISLASYPWYTQTHPWQSSTWPRMRNMNFLKLISPKRINQRFLFILINNKFRNWEITSFQKIFHKYLHIPDQICINFTHLF